MAHHGVDFIKGSIGSTLPQVYLVETVTMGRHELVADRGVQQITNLRSSIDFVQQFESV